MIPSFVGKIVHDDENFEVFFLSRYSWYFTCFSSQNSFYFFSLQIEIVQFKITFIRLNPETDIERLQNNTNLNINTISDRVAFSLFLNFRFNFQFYHPRDCSDTTIHWFCRSREFNVSTNGSKWSSILFKISKTSSKFLSIFLSMASNFVLFLRCTKTQFSFKFPK